MGRIKRKDIPRRRSRSDKEWIAEQQSMKEYRREHFKVICEPTDIATAYGGDDEYVLRVTHNGRQWNTISVLIEEIDAFIEALETARMNYKRRKNNGIPVL